MTAPAHTARTVPPDKMLRDGHPTTLAFSLDPDVSLWEKGITPPGIDNGDPIETVTMHTVAWRQSAPRQLKTLTPITLRCGYNPAVYTQLLALVGKEGAVTVHFPNQDRLSLFAYLQTWEPDENTEGENPEGTATIQPTNTDPVTGAEEPPVFAAFVPPP